ncbi:MAG: methyl-accepting chemotaxis protein [Betaproteobacteria bacterium]|nr:methyl-accepting chemotaxis protein [Betaproteobacteria bacterium]
MQSSKIGRFDQSFVVRMIRDFFLLLIVVTGVELGLRFLVVLYEFENHDRVMVGVTAKQLASDVKSIMLNSGGPVAARTVYPILKRNYEELGLAIAIVPAEVTVSSIKARFNMEPQGIAPQWASGRHNESTVALAAEQFCLNCHIHARIGDVLGTVTVRNYLSTKLTAWWAEVRLTSMLWAVNIITHTIVLFLLLKIRMEPLLTLRSTVSTLAKGVIDLSHRATIKSHDEFGELALDLNHFLDRIVHIVEDLDEILTRMVAVGHRLNQVSDQMNEQFAKIHDSVQGAIRRSFDGHKEGSDFPQGGSGSIDAIVSTLNDLGADNRLPEEMAQKLRGISDRFETAIREAEDISRRFDRSGEVLLGLSGEVHGFTHFLKEMAVLEEKMQVVAESGQVLLNRLTHTRPGRSSG